MNACEHFTNSYIVKIKQMQRIENFQRYNLNYSINCLKIYNIFDLWPIEKCSKRA